jgi:hypothetical protein
LAKRVKELLYDDRQRIRLHDLVMKEVARIRGVVLDPDSYPLEGAFSGELLADRLSTIERECSGLMTMFGVAGYWGAMSVQTLWSRALARLASVPRPKGSYIVPYESIRRYPALLSAYAAGVAAVAADRLESLVAHLVDLSVADLYSGTDEPFAVAVNTSTVLDYDFQRKLPGRERSLTPFSDRLWNDSGLGEALAEVVSDSEEFTRSFDLYEYLAGLIGYDLHGWAPVGCFLWRGRARGNAKMMDVVNTLDLMIQRQGDGLSLVKVGAFGGSLERMYSARQAYEATFLGRVY